MPRRYENTVANILIVDDSSIMRRNLRSILQQDGHVVVGEASNGEEGLKLYDQFKPDLVTMDVTMPVMDGIAAVKRIMALHPEARIVVISAFDQRNMLFEAMENGAKHYMIKPITSDKLRSTIRTVLQGPPSETVNKEQALPADSSMSAEPFRIDNREGEFWFHIYARSAVALEGLHAALQGLLFIKPLTVTIMIAGPAPVTEGAWDSIQLIIDRIRGAGGRIRLGAEAAHTIDLRRMAPDVELLTGANGL